MSGPSIPAALRQRIGEQARGRCGYCLTVAALVGTEFEIDHLVPRSRGGQTEETNLWLACSDCNDIKSNRMYGFDPLTRRTAKLFNPRLQMWTRHFEWHEGGILVVGRTASGRATVETLRLNRPALVRARKLWIGAGFHPPAD
jgi:hypothetical protein